MLPKRPPLPSVVGVPLTVAELGAWEQYALHGFLSLPKVAAHHAAQQQPDGLAYVTRRLLPGWLHGRPGADSANALSDVMPAELAAQILLCLGYDRLKDLHKLGRWYSGVWSSRMMAEPLEFITVRHRLGYTSTVLQRVAESSLPHTFMGDWCAVFSVADLRLCWDAGLSDLELKAALVTGVLPDRDTLQVLAGLSI